MSLLIFFQLTKENKYLRILSGGIFQRKTKNNKESLKCLLKVEMIFNFWSFLKEKKTTITMKNKTFYGWCSTASKATGPLQGGSLLFFTSKFPEIPGTHLTELRRMKH